MNKINIRSQKSPQRIKADPDKGLTSAQVAERKSMGYDNCPADPPSKSVGEIITDNLFTYFNFILFILLSIISHITSFLSFGNKYAL